MSFILDALKKSEAERQRQAGPTLLELRITRPRRRYPLWSLLVGALLAINVAVLLVFLLRRPPPLPATAPSASAAVTASTPATVAGGPASPAPAPAPVASAATAATAATAAATTATAAAHTAAGTAAVTNTVPDLADTAHAPNPADYTPALSPTAGQPESAAARVTTASTAPDNAADYSSLPSISEIDGNVPAMQLDLLDYSRVTSERYALINMHRVREGDVLPDGARVLAITPNGVAMNYHGQDFLLRPGGTAQ